MFLNFGNANNINRRIQMIVDAHTHLGYDTVFEIDFTLSNLLSGMEKNKIDVSIVQPGTTLDLDTAVTQHNNIAGLSRSMPGRIFGLANPSPHLETDKYREELRRCINDLGFVGVKLHPLAHAVLPTNSKGTKVFQAASDLGIPVMVHTGTGVPWSLPSALISVAKNFPEVKIVMAHSGGNMFLNEAVLAAQLCPNIYLETSWLPGVQIKRCCKTIGAQRIMLGSDQSINVATEITKYRTIDLSEDELSWCLGKTAIEVFDLEKRLLK